MLGINQQIETNSGANDGVGFAVPVSAIKRSIAQLRENGKAEYAYIGVSSQALYPQLAEKLGLDTDFGGLIAEVVPGGPAEKAGLEGGDEKLVFQGQPYRTGGDVILQVDGQDVVEVDDLASLVAEHEPGDKVELTILRDGKRKNRSTVTLGQRPDTPTATAEASPGPGRVSASATHAAAHRCRTPALLQEVALGQKTLSDYTHIVGKEVTEQIRELAEPLKGKRVLHVSATAFGGGVSEILYTIVPLMRDIGLDAHWHVIFGKEEFFNATKLLHNSLQGAPETLSDEQWELFDEINQINAEGLQGEWDVVIVHDPQPIGLRRGAREKGKHWIWRCHIDLSNPEPGPDRAPAAADRGIRRQRLAPARLRPERRWTAPATASTSSRRRSTRSRRRTWPSRPRTPPSSAASSGSTSSGR